MKSRTTSAILTVLFGPLGMLYAHAGYAILLTIAAVISLPTGFGPLIAWIVAIFWGDALAKATHQQPQAVQQEAPQPVQQVPKAEGVPKIVEFIIMAAIVGFLVFVLPGMLGAEAGESSINFYLRYFGI